MSERKFFGTISHLGKVYAIVGDDSCVERVRKALGSAAAITPSAASAPLPLAPGCDGDAPPAPAPAAQDDSPSQKTYDRVRSGRFDDSAPRDGAKWAMVRPPAAVAPKLAPGAGRAE